MAADAESQDRIKGSGLLTTASLLAEPLCRNATLWNDRADADRRIEWCLPLTEAMRGKKLQTGALIFVRPDEEVPDIDVLARKAAVSESTVMLPFGQNWEEHARRLDAVGVTVIAFDGGTIDFSQLSKLVAQKVLTPKSHILEYGVMIHETLAELLYRGAGLTAMVQHLSRLSGCPVFLMDTHLDAITYEALTPTPVPDPSEVGRLIRDIISNGQLSPPGQERVRASMVRLHLEDEQVLCIVCPIVLGGTTYGWLTLVELSPELGNHQLAQHFAIAEYGATVTGSEMLRLRSVSEAEERARGDFIHALLHDRFSDAHELAARAEHHKFNVRSIYGVVVGAGAFDLRNTTSVEQQWNVARAIRSPKRPNARWTTATVVGDLLAVVREVAPADTPRNVAAEEKALATFAHELGRDLRARLGPHLRLAYGRTGLGAQGVAASYRDARVTLAVAEHADNAQTCGYSELRVFATLSSLAASPQGIEFACEILSPLRRDDSTPDDTERVVLSYIKNGGHLNATARAVHMHRNTVLYKLDRAARLLDMDLRAADDRFTVWLAHKLDVLGRAQRSLGQEIDRK
jgi:sugar diacid utilization regulator